MPKAANSFVFFSFVLDFYFPIIVSSFAPFWMNCFLLVFLFFYFFETVKNPRSLPLETIPLRSLSENESVTILARILSNGSVVNVLIHLFFFIPCIPCGPNLVLVFKSLIPTF